MSERQDDTDRFRSGPGGPQASPSSGIPLIEAKLGGFNERFRDFFASYSSRLLRRSFNAVRLTPGSVDAAERANRTTGPLLMVMNHASWWDPLLALVIGSRMMPRRRGIAPMDAEQLRRFAILRRIGIFGIDPDDPGSLEVLLDYVGRYVRSGVHARPSVIITPQGTFADVREPIRLRPGAAAVLARLQRSSALAPASVLTMNVEYAFWQDKRPEVFVRLESMRLEPRGTGDSEARSIVRFNRMLTDSMQAGADELAGLVRSRDPGRFVVLAGRRGAAVHPVYDAYLRMTGRGAEIDSKRSARPSGGEDSLERADGGGAAGGASADRPSQTNRGDGPDRNPPGREASS